jgi:hypothetical protein
MTTVITLLLGHLLGDFPLQTNKVFKLKTQGNLGLSLHVAIHMAVTALLIHEPWQYWPLLLLLGVAHFTTDWIKLHFPGKNQAAGFVLDQLVHYITILLIGFWVPDLPAVLPTWIMIPAIVLGFIPAVMTFFWVWANQVQQAKLENEPICITWASASLLTMSQRIGQIIVLLIFIAGSGLMLM